MKELGGSFALYDFFTRSRIQWVLLVKKFFIDVDGKTLPVVELVLEARASVLLLENSLSNSNMA